MNVLLVEDNEDHATLVQWHLKQLQTPPNIRWARKLAEGLSILETEQPDVVLLDLRLPDSDLPQTLSTVLERASLVPVIVLTSLDDVELGARSVKQGAQDFLVKSSLTVDKLERSIRYSVERNRTQAELQRYAADLEQNKRVLDEFARIASHDLQTPLRGIHNDAQFLIDRFGGVMDDKAKEVLMAVKNSSEKMACLVDTLLESSRRVGVE